MNETILNEIMSIMDTCARSCFVDTVQGQYPYVDGNGDPIPAIEVEGSIANTLRRLDPRALTRTAADVNRTLRSVHANAIMDVEDYVAGRLMEVAVAQVDLATGIKVGVKDPKTGEVMEVYTERPDGKVGVSILDRFLGRPLQRQEVHSTGGNNNVVVFIPHNGRDREGIEDRPIDTTPPPGHGPIIDILPEKSEGSDEPLHRVETRTYVMPERAPAI